MFAVPTHRRWLALLASLALVLVVAGCGDDDKKGPDSEVTGSRTLTVYASLPLQGTGRAEARDSVDAVKLALSQAHGRVGAFTVNLAVLDDSTAKTGDWDRAQTIDNATRAARDRNTIAVLGDVASDATALSIPILNEAQVLQVSPASTYIGLTKTGGVAKGEPEKYYPSGERTFGRVVPSDDHQAAVLVSRMKAGGVRSVYLVNDRGLYGKGLAGQVRLAAEKAGIAVVGDEAIKPEGADYRSLAKNVLEARPGAFFYGGTVRNGASPVLRDVAAANPNLPLYGGDALLLSDFARTLPARAARNLTISSPAVGPGAQPAEGRAFERRFKRQFGRTPTPTAVFSYEGMRVLLRSIAGAGAHGNDREAVIKSFFNARDVRSALGPITIDDEGDVSFDRYGLWKVRGGRLVTTESTSAGSSGA